MNLIRRRLLQRGAAALAAALLGDYLIGPGDTININVWRNPEVSHSLPLRPDGKITTPLVEDLQAAAKTSTALARDIEKALEKYIQQAVVTVIVTDFAAGNKARIVRSVDGRQVQLAVRLQDLLRDGDISANVALRPGDVLVIPESWF